MTAEITEELRTLDLAEFAQLNRGEKVVIEPISNHTQELFDQTLNLFEIEGEEATVTNYNQTSDIEIDRYVPTHEDLRKIYLFAEALGGYETLNELVSDHSTTNQMSVRLDKLDSSAFSEKEIQQLEQQQKNLNRALQSANEYLLQHANEDFNRRELAELHHILVNASTRNDQITKILGIYKIGEIEKAIARLHAFQEKIRSVEKNISGIFLVDSEVLFIPTNDLIECVNTIFSGVGNPYLADNIDGVMLLAARNLLIQAVSFYSYYGKERIYNLVSKSGTTVSTAVISHHIRNEIHGLFKACEADNRLVLKRVMQDAERQFEISVEEIQKEAEHSAVAAVKEMLPREVVKQKVVKKSLFKKILSWFKS